MDPLSSPGQGTAARWARCYQALPFQTGTRWSLDSAVHALLARLRRCLSASDLFHAYETEAAGDFSLIGSLLEHYPRPELLWCVRDAAYYLRWLELTGTAG